MSSIPGAEEYSVEGKPIVCFTASDLRRLYCLLVFMLDVHANVG